MELWNGSDRVTVGSAVSLIPHSFTLRLEQLDCSLFMILLTRFMIIPGFITVFLSEQYFLFRR